MRISLSDIELVSPKFIKSEELYLYTIKNKEFLEEFEPKRNDEFYTIGFQEELLKREEIEFYNKVNYKFYIKHDDILIGSIALTNIVYGPFCSCFLGYKLDKDYVNRGYMQKAVLALTNFAFNSLDLHRIEANVMPRNKASIRVLEKIGYKSEGVAKKYLKINGEWEDHIHYVILNENME